MLNIKDLAPYMLSDKSIKNILNKKINPILKKKEIHKIIPKKNNMIKKFFSAKKGCDKLIWYHHILLNGLQSYHFLGSNSYGEEKKMKIDLVYKIRENKQLLKNHKIRYRDVEANLCNDDEIQMNTFLALLIISEINFYYSDDKFYYTKLINCDLDKYCYVHKKEGNYYLWHDEEKPKFEEISKKLITIDNINKPLKTISSYKKPELEEWCKKLKIKYEFIGQKKPTKNKLYALIQEKLI
jgi:hypothetical protein